MQWSTSVLYVGSKP